VSVKSLISKETDARPYRGRALREHSRGRLRESLGVPRERGRQGCSKKRTEQLSLKQISDKERKRQQDFIVVRAELSSRGDDPIRESSPRSETVITW
jgi:hypothetical protein